MVHVLIIEDEEPAAGRLLKMLKEIDPGIVVLDVIVSVNSAVDWLKQHTPPDLILMDIHLADGESFEIFKKTEVTSPVIFITAYDEYAIRAFKVNSIDYLLKPVKKDDLQQALGKFHKLHTAKPGVASDFSKLLETLKAPKQEYKKRFIIRFGDHIKSIDAKDVAYFFTEDKINFLKTHDNKTYPVDYNLDKLEAMLEPAVFFRINRQFIISIKAIDQMFAFSKSRVKVKLVPPTDADTIVSTERSADFKDWLGGDR
ncbi:MAG: LytTR family DNA-binding domain-containing protein [Bacteroidetes bacterium]|nr:LytTR family DNA-binding domain-containing protein [Bacteroidota bacterium]